MTNPDLSIESATEAIIESIYENLINAWNETNVQAFANLFSENGTLVGFDGSMANGRREIHDHLSSIFADHRPAKFVHIIREIRMVTPVVGLLRAVVGMVPPGNKLINPGTNAIQSAVVVNETDHLRIALFQNTPAAFHGRPELAEDLTKELQQRVEELLHMH